MVPATVGVCLRSTTAAGGALVLSSYMDTGAGLTQKNWQILCSIGQWQTSQALPFIIGGDFHQQAARRSWRAWLEENTTAGAAKVHQLIREQIGFQAARGNAVDEQLKLREAWAATWRANAVKPALAWPEDNGPLFHRPSVGAMRMVLTSFRAATGLGYDAVIYLIVRDMRMAGPVQSKAAGGVRPTGLLFAIVRVQCKLRRIEGKMWEARRFFLGHAGAWRRAVCLGAGSVG